MFGIPLTALFVRRPTLVVVLLALVALAGVLAFLGLVQQNFPNIDFPTIRVHLNYPGASTSEIRDAIVRPIEDAIAGAPELDHLATSIQAGQANVTATFSLSSNQTSDLVEVQRRVASTRAVLPQDLSAPTIGTFDPAQTTVATLSVTSKSLTPATLSAIVTNEIVPKLEQVPGVSNVNAPGAVTPAIEVNVRPETLAAQGFTLGDVVQAISNNNVRAPGGIAYGARRETAIDVRGDLTTPASVARLPLVRSGAGTTGGAHLASAGTSAAGPAPAASTSATSSGGPALGSLNPWSVAARALSIGDVANVVAGAEAVRAYSYVGADRAISLGVQKATGASEIAASQAVLAALPKLEAEYPAIDFGVLNVQADFTQQQLDSVYRSLVEGIAFTGLVMLFFLRSWRNAIVVLVAIPTSLLVTLFVMRLANFTIDTISLLAMTLVIGILVDDSIVVLENTERHYEDGEAPQTAAILARSEIGAAAVIITLVDVVVFLPIAFLPGTVGRFLAEFGLVVVVATLTSLVVSFTVTPALAGNWSLRSTWKPPGIVDAFTRVFEAARRLYAVRILGWALDRPISVAVVSFALTAGALSLVPLGYVGFEFIPAVDRGEIFLQLTFPTGTPLATTDAAISSLETRIARFPDVAKLTGTSGTYASGFGGPTAEASAGQIHVFLVDRPKRSTLQWVAILNKIAQRAYPDAKPIAIPATGTGGGNAQPLDYTIVAADDEPERYAPAILAALKATPGALNPNDSASRLDPQVDVVFDRERARALDVDIATAANAVRASFGGTLAAQFETSRGTQYVQVTYPRRAQTTVATIPKIPIRTRAGALAYVGDVARLVESPQPPLMTRVNRETVVHIGANVAPGAVLSHVQSGFLARVAALHLAGVSVVPNAGGNARNLADTVGGLGTSLVLSFALVFLLMVALYDSYRLPFIIMFAIPVASVGALGSLALTGESLNLFSLIGTVLLVGLVSKNGILLVDFANHRIRAGMDRRSAIVESAFARFRPIVMTTFSMIAGMTPIALATDPAGAARRSLGVVVIGGLTSSLVLTLVLVPVAFVWFAPRHPHRDSAGDETAALPAYVEVTA